MREPMVYNTYTLGAKAFEENTKLIGGKYVPARPISFGYGLRWRIRVAWMVFTGRADVIRWPGQEK